MFKVHIVSGVSVGPDVSYKRANIRIVFTLWITVCNIKIPQPNKFQRYIYLYISDQLGYNICCTHVNESIGTTSKPYT